MHKCWYITVFMFLSWCMLPEKIKRAFHWLSREKYSFICLPLSQMVLMKGCLHKVYFGWYKDTNCNLGFIEERRIIFGISLFSSVQFSSVTQSCLNLCDPMSCSTPVLLSITTSWSSLRLTSIKSMMPSSHLILSRPLLHLPPIPPSIRVFSNETTLCMRRPKYWSFSFSIIPFKETPGLISFRMDWLDLLAVQGTLKSLLQHHSSKASILWHSAFFTVQLSHP